MRNVQDHPTAKEMRQTIADLKRGGGGGTYDSMEARVARLEGKLDRVEDRLSSIEVMLARIDAKLDSKVDYKWLTVYVLGIVAVIMRSEIASFFTAGTTP